jgi:hypothetical protein
MSTHYFLNLSRHIENWRHDSDQRATNLCRTQKLKQLFEKILGKLMPPRAKDILNGFSPKAVIPRFNIVSHFFMPS